MKHSDTSLLLLVMTDRARETVSAGAANSKIIMSSGCSLVSPITNVTEVIIVNKVLYLFIVSSIRHIFGYLI
jgi:hypothetical protein